MSTRYQKSGNYSKSKYEEFWKNGFIVLRNLMSHEHCDYSYFLAKSVANKDFAQIMHLHREDFLIALGRRVVGMDERLCVCVCVCMCIL